MQGIFVLKMINDVKTITKVQAEGQRRTEEIFNTYSSIAKVT